MHYDPIDYEVIQRRVRERVQRRYRFYFHTAIFILGIPIIGAWTSALFFLVWVGFWISHLLWNNYQNNLELAVEQEIDKELNRVVKRKRDYADIYEQVEQIQAQYEYADDDYETYPEGRPEWLGDDGEIIGYEDDWA